MNDTEQIKTLILDLGKKLDGRLVKMEKTLIGMTIKFESMGDYEELKLKVHTMETKFSIVWAGISVLGLILITAIGGTLIAGI